MSNCNFWASRGRLFQDILSSLWKNYQSLLTSVNVFRCSFIVVIFVHDKDSILLLQASHEWVKFYHKVSIPVLWGGYQGDFALITTWPRGHCLIKFHHPWGKSWTLLHPFYNSPGCPGGLPPGQADDTRISCQSSCILRQENVIHLLPSAVSTLT